ncbi:unnamed protein product [Closterium sp. NIES-64]|nr:unnamed protein product [Closterium sp. NIES-64]
MTALDADNEDNPYDVAYLAEDDYDMDIDDKVGYPDEDEKDEEYIPGEGAVAVLQGGATEEAADHSSLLCQLCQLNQAGGLQGRMKHVDRRYMWL